MDQHVNADFSFAFDNKFFSNRKLRIEIMHDLQRPSFDNKDTSSEDDLSNDMDCSDRGSKVRSLYINSSILAEKSPFFMKLFSIGMKESNEPDVTIHISCSEEVAFMDLLQFIYKGTLEAHSTAELLDVLMVADKFDTKSCVDHCTRALQNSSLFSIESASLYLQLPPIMLTSPRFLQLTDAAKWFLILCFEHSEKDKLLLEEELLNLPLSAMEVVLASDELALTSEDVLYDFVVKWARNNYDDVDDRREILSNMLSHSLLFPYLSHQKVREAVSSDDLDNACKSSIYNVRNVCKTMCEKMVKFNRMGYPNRKVPVRVLECDAPHPRCVAFLTLHANECQLFKSRPVLYFQDFMFKGFKIQPLASQYFEKDGFSIDCHIIYPERGEQDFNGGKALDDNNVDAQVGDCAEKNAEIVIQLDVLSKEDLGGVFVKQYGFAFPKNLRSRELYVKGDYVYAPKHTSRFFFRDTIYFNLLVTLYNTAYV